MDCEHRRGEGEEEEGEEEKGRRRRGGGDEERGRWIVYVGGGRERRRRKERRGLWVRVGGVSWRSAGSNRVAVRLVFGCFADDHFGRHPGNTSEGVRGEGVRSEG